MADEPTMPTHIQPGLGKFDRFASTTSNLTSRAAFFVACVLLIAIWAPSYPLWSSADTWQLIINTITTVVTFLLVALLQNAQHRADASVQHKLNAIADGLAQLMEESPRLREATDELRAAVGLESRESA